MTPETDKAERMAYLSEYMVPTDFARRLEKERDEYREQLKLATTALNRIHAEVGDWIRSIVIFK